MRTFSCRSTILFILALIGVAFGASPGSGEVLKESLTFSKSDLRFNKLNGYDQVFLARCDLTAKPGEPQLPVYIANLALPEGKEVVGVEILATEGEDLPGSYLLYPVQPPQILSLTKDKPIPFEEPKSAI